MSPPVGAPVRANVGESLQDAAVKGVEAINLIVAERDKLRADVDSLTGHLSLLRERSNQLDSRLALASAERDHYLRYATELTSKLNDIQMLILTCVEASKLAAYKPPIVPGPAKQQVVSDADAAKLEELVRRLPGSRAGNGEAA